MVDTLCDKWNMYLVDRCSRVLQSWESGVKD